MNFVCVCSFVIAYSLLPAVKSAFIMINTVLPMKQTACIQTFRGTACGVGSQLLGSHSKNFRGVVGPF